MKQLFQELKRRNVYKVAVAYAAAAFVVVQAARLLVPALLLPDWIYRAVVLAAILGFPIALVIAWAFELTPEGVQRTSEEAGEEARTSMSPEERRTQSRLAMKALVGLGLVGAVVAGGWYLMGGGGGGQGSGVSDRSVAVLPFETLGDTASTPFTEGLHNDLLSRLQQVSELTTIARPSVMRYEDTDKPLSQVAEELNARWIVTAAVQAAGDQVQVHPRLIDPRTGTERWSDSYRRDLTAKDVFELQTDITKQITRSLEAELSPAEAERVAHRPTENLDAYRLYVRGRTHLSRRTEAGMRQAMDYFQQALAQDSSYALAWSGLADAWTLLAWYGHVGSDTMSAPALKAARTAVRLDPDLAEAHTALGHLERYRGNMPPAVRELEKAVELRPGSAAARRELSELLGALGHRQGALEHAERAVELSPHSPPNRSVLGWTYWWIEGPGKRALEQVREASALEPGYAFAHASEGLLLSDAGRQESAMAAVQRGVERAQQGTRAWAVSLGGLGVVFVRQGNPTEAEDVLARLAEEKGTELERAMIHAARADRSAAFEALREMEWSGVNVRHLRFIDVFDPLRKDPRYRDLLTDIHTTWGLNPDGSLPDSVDVSFDAPRSDE